MLKGTFRSVQLEKKFWVENWVGDYFWICWEQFPEGLG